MNETLQGVIVGSVITAGFTYLLESLRFSREEKLYFKRKKEETYLEMQDVVTELLTNILIICKNKKIADEITDKTNRVRSKVDLYCEQEVADEYKEIIKEFIGITLAEMKVSPMDFVTKLGNRPNELIANMKEDLGIKN